MNKSALIITLIALVANAEVYNVTSDPTNLCPTKQVTRANGRLACTDGTVFIEGGQGGLLAPNHKSSPKPLVRFATDWNARIGWYINHDDTLMVVDLTTEAQRLQQRFNASNEIECKIPEPDWDNLKLIPSKKCNKLTDEWNERTLCMKQEAFEREWERLNRLCSKPENQYQPNYDPGLEPMSEKEWQAQLQNFKAGLKRKLK